MRERTFRIEDHRGPLDPKRLLRVSGLTSYLYPGQRMLSVEIETMGSTAQFHLKPRLPFNNIFATHGLRDDLQY